MQTLFKKSKLSVLLIMPLLFLFQSLSVNAQSIQLISRTDSICLCGLTDEIDSTIKIVKDYPKLKRQANKCEQLYNDLAKLTANERAELLRLIGLKDWDFEEVKRQIRRIKFKKWIWGAGGVGAGAVITLITIVIFPT